MFPIECKKMTKTLIIPLLLFVVSCNRDIVESRPANANATQSTLFEFEMETIDGDKLMLAEFKGKKILIVNTASKCGFTPQYADLQKLHELYGDKVTILGFPANNFLSQEPGSNDEIALFCKENYGVSFQMFSKLSVKGTDQSELYKWLSTKDLNGWNDTAPNWNFCKYLIDEDGQLQKFYGSEINPLSDEILKELN